MSNEFDQIGVLYMAIKSFIVKFDTIECVSLLFGCCNIKIWLYKLNQVNFSGENWYPSTMFENLLRQHYSGITLPFFRNNAETYN